MDPIEIPPKDEEELLLEKLVFGDIENFEINLKQTENFFDSSDEYESADESEDQSEDEFFIDDDGDDMEVDEEADSASDSDSENAWSDSEDENVTVALSSSNKLKKLRAFENDNEVNGKSYINRLRSQFEKIYPKPAWVEKLTEETEEQEQDEDEEDYDDDEQDDEIKHDSNSILKILKTTDKFIITKQLKLISPHKLSISRLKDANQSRRAKGGIQSMCFHPTSPLLLTGGFDKTARVYYIDGNHNELVTSLFVRNCPIYSCSFSTVNNKNLIFVSGRRKFMNKWDLDSDEIEKISRMYGYEKFQKSMESLKISKSGKYLGLMGSSGYCNILNGLTGQFMMNFKIEGTIIDFDFSSNERELIIVNTNGEVWEFQLSDNQLTSNNKPTKRWSDESGIGITKIKLGGKNSKYLAIGTNNGIVNLYDRSKDEANPKPFKVIDNLITTISTLQFSPDGQLLVVASRGKRDALKIVHLPSGSVYSNWPTSGTPLGKVLSVAFSPNNKMLAVGNDAGKVTLWRLNHY
ncbi:U3 small nucleolar RNA-associated protein 18 [[Candida] jaroonii]|uniref:U3 small nucleolar RNA-associated protein 18 n=1 Tax=[Candida] jaroonii TaxID=467808 RepID=A0ACA9Y5I8_9ASCO|nr:U3 small nucleolar RNA-associated protein 18 [[Candida] jaroonii]